MKSFVLCSLFLAFLSLCFAGSFTVTDRDGFEAGPNGFQFTLKYVPNYFLLDEDFADNVTDYYVHLQYDANIINPVGLNVTQVQDQPAIIPSSTGNTYLTNDDVFIESVSDTPIPTVTEIEAAPNLLVEIIPPTNSIQGTQISLTVSIENVGDRRPITPSVDFVLPGDFIDLLGATSNRPDVSIEITTVNGDYSFHITWNGASDDGAASDVDITIDIFLHDDACTAFESLGRRSDFVLRQGGNDTSGSGSSSGNSSSSTPVICPDLTQPIFEDIPAECLPESRCSDDLETLLPTGACGGFCLQGSVFPNYGAFYNNSRARNFIVHLTDDPTQPGAEDPTYIYFFAFLPTDSSSNPNPNDGGEDDSSSQDLVIILLPLFLGLLCLCCVAILIAALLAALWWFLTGREKMHTRVQWIPGRNKGGDDDGL